MKTCVMLVGGLALAAVLLSRPAVAAEVQYPSDDFAKLDTFEAIAVEDADKLFAKKDYPGAYAAYKAYSIEFAQGRALSYVLLRMGRCLHLAGKRNTAVKAYQDVVDYFPDDVRYAAAALYYIGECHIQNGNEEKAFSVWAKLVRDKDYVQQANSGTALIRLATAMQERGNYAEAADYQWRTAVAFRKTNRRAADEARKAVVYHYAVRSPNQGKLLAFCNEVGGFGWHQKIEKPEDSATYWKHVLSVALSAKLEDQKRIEVARYWDGQMGDRFADNDALRVAWFNARLAHDKDAAAWAERMDAQFRLKPVSVDRVKQWLSLFGRAESARDAFYKKHGEPLITGLSNDEKLKLLNHLRHPHRMHEQAMALTRSISTNGMDDKTLSSFASIVADYEGEEAFLRTVVKMKDPVAAARARFDWYMRKDPRRNSAMRDKALAEVPVLSKSPDHAQSIIRSHAQLVEWQGDFQQAIKLYRRDKNPKHAVQVTKDVVHCYLQLKQYGEAIKLTEGLEQVGGHTASEACLRIADIYRLAGEKGKEVQQLQLVLRRYPKSSHSSIAHERLENYGVKIIGGEAEAEE